MDANNKHNNDSFNEVIAKLINVIIILIMIIIVMFILLYTGLPKRNTERKIEEIQPKVEKPKNDLSESYWQAPDTNTWKEEPNGKEIRFGHAIIANTTYYFGPRGSIQKTGNGMNCQNCHLDAGTKIFGNNYSAVAATYPKFRARSGKIETIAKRVNDCFERSLNGKGIDSSSIEMKAIVAYLQWLGKNIPRGEKPQGSGLKDLDFLSRAASVEKGKLVYDLKCASCHQQNGAGKLRTDGLAYQYPPLWGDYSYNQGAGLFRLSRFAAYVKYNMPQGVTFENTQLSDEEAWDVAAFVNSQPRPKMDLHNDWPNISAKPIDHPFGPYDDKFSENQHKYGPFTQIAETKKVTTKTKH